MDIATQVQWVNSIKEHYGNSVEAVMESHVQSHQAHSTQVALNTQMFGLISVLYPQIQNLNFLIFREIVELEPTGIF